MGRPAVHFQESAMNVGMWIKALRVIPRITKEEWDGLDIVSRWLIATRSAVLIITFISAALAGLLAYQAGKFNLGLWLLVTLGLVLAHATNNLVNDVTDFVKGVDKDNYFRAQYGPQPLEHGLLTMRQLAVYIAVTGLAALAIGLYLAWFRGLGVWLLLGSGVFFVLFYTFPLKYIGLGELAVLVVWGPLMIGGGYYVITGEWSWLVALAGLPYALGATTVIFGKHIDKCDADRAKHIRTLPVLIGEKAGRYTVLAMMVLQYVAVIGLTLAGFFTPVVLIVALALPALRRVWAAYRQPRPAGPPADYPPNIWPLWFVALAFEHNRVFGLWFLLGLIGDLVLRGAAAAWVH
jgi:1,4-dihydroxy-2-naphthoate polyprenyltransferase